MLGYVTVGTNDLERAATFYDAIAKEMGVGRMMEFPTFIAWGEMGGAPGPGNDDFQSPAAGRFGILDQTVRCAMGRDDAGFMGDPQFLKDFGGQPHHRPVRLTAHDDADLGGFACCHGILAGGKRAPYAGGLPRQLPPAGRTRSTSLWTASIVMKWRMTAFPCRQTGGAR